MKRLSRSKEIVSIIIKYGFGEWLANTQLDWIKKAIQSVGSQSEVDQLTAGERARLACEELGTTFIKFGQMLSTRADLVGEEVAAELSKLQSHGPIDSVDWVRSTIDQELGLTLEEVFSEFQQAPMASASIGQVHKATLKTGEEVVVKIIHEGIEETIEQDLAILNELVSLVDKYGPSTIKTYQPLNTFRLFKRSLKNELDFRKEARNLNVFRENFKKDDRVVFPKPYKEFSSSHLLVMDFLDGVSVRDITSLNWSNAQKQNFAYVAADVFLEMVMRDKFYHADPHPGNLLILPDGRLGVLDVGMVGRMDSATTKSLDELIIAFTEEDMAQIKAAILELGNVPQDVNKQNLESDIEDFLYNHIYGSLSEIQVAEVLQDLLRLVQAYKIMLPPSIASVGKLLAMLEGTMQLIDPTFQVTEFAKEYKVKIILRKTSMQSLKKRVLRNFRVWDKLFEKAPAFVVQLINRLEEDEFRVYLEHRNLEGSVNRLVIGLISSSIFLGSTILMALKVPPLMGNTSVLGLLGVFTAIALFLYLLRSIFKSK